MKNNLHINSKVSHSYLKTLLTLIICTSVLCSLPKIFAQDFSPIEIKNIIDDGTFDQGPLSGKFIKNILQKKEYIKAAIGVLTYARCLKYLPKNVPLIRCRQGATSAVKALDFEQMDNPYLMGQTLRLVFKNELIQLVKSPEISNILTTINNRSITELNLSRPINLLNLFSQEEFRLGESLKKLAILLQDPTNSRLHLTYIDLLLEKEYFTQIESVIVKQNLQLLRNFLDYTQSYETLVETLPKLYSLNLKSNPSVDRGYYHFYVVAYLASKINSAMIKEYHAHSLYINYISASSFNYFYEVLNLPEIKNKSFADLLAYELSIKTPIITSSHTATDIYLGHLGALYGSGNFYTFISLENFILGLASKPHELYKSIVNRLAQVQ